MHAQEESKPRRAIIREWDDWARNNPVDSKSAAGSVLFFVHLQQDKSGLLGFHPTGDQWQPEKCSTKFRFLALLTLGRSSAAS